MTTPTPQSPIEVIRAADWGIEHAEDGAWIIRSPRQDLFALSEDALTPTAVLLAAEHVSIDTVVAQIAQRADALRLDPVPVTYPNSTLPDPLCYGHHRGAHTVYAPLHIWRPLPKGRSKHRYVTLCGIIMTEMPGSVDLAIPGLRLCRDCGRMLSAMHTGATQTPQPAKPVELHGWVWEHNTRTLGALGYWRLCNRATGFATADVPDPSDAVVRALVRLRQQLRQAKRIGLSDTEHAAEVLQAFGWPVERLGDTSWQLSTQDRSQQAVLDPAALLRAAQLISARTDQSFDTLVAVSTPATMHGAASST